MDASPEQFADHQPDQAQLMTHDNAVSESFNSTLEWELLRDNHFCTRKEARHAIAAWIDDYNSQRRHSTNGMLSPIDYEHACTQQQTTSPGSKPDEGRAA
jgi:transposase InsO family protein